MAFILALQVQDISATIACTSVNCTTSQFTLTSAVTPLCKNFVPSNTSAAQNLVLDLTLFCACSQGSVADSQLCNLTFVGKYFFDVNNTNLTVISQEADIRIHFVVTVAPSMQLYCGVFDNGYSATWTNAGGCKPSRSVDAGVVVYKSCFGFQIAVSESIAAKVPKFVVTVADVYNDVQAEIVLPIELQNANVVSVEMNASTVAAFNQSTGELVISKQALGVYSPTIVYRDECGTSYVYNERLTIYSLTFRNYNIVQNVDCTGANCVFKATLANISQFSSSVCAHIYFDAPALYNFTGEKACVQTQDDIVVNITGEFNIFNGATISFNYDNFSRVNLAQMTYFADFQIKLQNVPEDTALELNEYCTNAAYEQASDVGVVENATYIASIAGLVKPYGCSRPLTMMRTAVTPLTYALTYISCFNRTFSETIVQEIPTALIMDMGQPYLVSGNNFTLLLNVSTLIDKVNFSAVVDFKIGNGNSVIQASFAQFNAPDQLRLYFELAETYLPGVYTLRFTDSGFCGGDFQIRLLQGQTELELNKALLFWPFSAADRVEQFDISTHNGTSTGYMFTGSCLTDQLFKLLASYIFRRACTFSGANVSVSLADFYVPSNSSNPLQFAVLNDAFVDGNTDVALLFEFSDEIFAQAARDLDQAVLCSAANQQYYVPNETLDFYAIAPTFNETEKTMQLQAVSRFDQRLSVVKNESLASLTMQVAQTGLLVCNYTYCVDNAVTVIVSEVLARTTAVALVDASQHQVELTKLNNTAWEIRLFNYQLFSGTYQIKVFYEDYCGNKYELVGNETFNVTKQIQLVFYNTSILTYSYASFFLEGDSGLKIDGEEITTGSYTKQYSCAFNDSNGVARNIDVTSVVTVDVAAGTIFADYTPAATYNDGTTNVTAPSNIRTLCEGTEFVLQIEAKMQNVGANLTVVLADQQNAVCAASAGVYSRAPSTFGARVIMCNKISPYLTTSNGKTAGDVAASNEVLARFENGQSTREAVVSNGALSNVSWRPRDFVSLPSFVKHELLQRFTAADARAVLRPYYTQSKGAIPDFLQFLSSSYRLFELLRQTNESALQFAIEDLGRASRSICPPIGLPSNEYLGQLSRLRSINANASLEEFFKAAAQNAQPQHGMDISFNDSQGHVAFTAPAAAQALTSVQMTLGDKQVFVGAELLQNGINVARKTGVYLFATRSAIHGEHIGDVVLYVGANATCSSSGALCSIEQSALQTKCMCTTAGSFSIDVQATVAQSFPAWAIALIVIGILLLIAIVLIIVLAIRNGALKKRRRITRIASATAVFA